MSTILRTSGSDLSLRDLKCIIQKEKMHTAQLLSKSQDLTRTCTSFQNQLRKVKSVIDDVKGTLLRTKHSCPYPNPQGY